jgi:two-component system KDP operon response regulator KdpE
MEKSRAKILIVDDNPSIRSFLKVPLSAKYDIIEAENAEQAKELYSREKPNLIILDLGLPNKDGFHVLETVRKKQKDYETKVIILTVRDDNISRNRADDLEADHYVTKPFRFGDVYELITNYLDG